MSKNEENNKSEDLTPFYKIYVYGEDNDKIEEIFVNPKINNTLGGHDGIYSLISSKFQNQYSPMKHTMKIKFTNYWYTINDINIYNFCVSGNLSTGENILIKLLQNTVINENIAKSKDIICPKCGEVCLINFNNYKIKLYECKNNHETNNI